MAEKRLARTRAAYGMVFHRVSRDASGELTIVRVGGGVCPVCGTTGRYDCPTCGVYITDNGFTANVIEGELHDPGDDPTT